jgi:DNA-binding PadR family transcriptional regulator
VAGLTREPETTALASGTLYPILMRLHEQQLLETGREPSDEPGCPPRHLSRLSSDGWRWPRNGWPLIIHEIWPVRR